VIHALAEYAPFSGFPAPTETSSSAGRPAAAANAGSNEVRKGVSAEEVQGILGATVSSSSNGPITTSVYRAASGSGTIEGDYFNGVAVEVRQRESAGSATIRKGMGLVEVEPIAGKPFETNSATHPRWWSLEASGAHDCLERPLGTVLRARLA
jgi:hypothetical protein